VYQTKCCDKILLNLLVLCLLMQQFVKWHLIVTRNFILLAYYPLVNLDVEFRISNFQMLNFESEITSIRLYTPCNPRTKAVYNLIEVISNEPNE
jgi:hypothetical protein